MQELRVMQTNEIDYLINEGEAMEYVYIGIKSKDTQDGMGKIHGATKLFATIEMNARMVKDIPLLKGLFNGMYQKVIMLHDPTLPATKVEPKAKKEKGLSPTQKSAVNALLEEGKGKDDEGLNFIAEEVGITMTRLKAYIQSF